MNGQGDDSIRKVSKHVGVFNAIKDIDHTTDRLRQLIAKCQPSAPMTPTTEAKSPTPNGEITLVEFLSTSEEAIRVKTSEVFELIEKLEQLLF